MIVMTGGVSRAKWQPIVDGLPALGMLLGPSAWRLPWNPIYALDNDCFANRDREGWWEETGERAWLGMLDKIPSGRPPLFVLLPDVVGDWPATLVRARRYLSEVRRRGLPIAIALQDGCDYDEAASLDPDWVFVGGSTAWKLANIEPVCAFFHPRGVRVHVGRVNGRIRLEACLRCGVDSVDGTGWSSFSDAMLPRLRRTLTRWREQTRFDLAEARAA